MLWLYPLVALAIVVLLVVAAAYPSHHHNSAALPGPTRQSPAGPSSSPTTSSGSPGSTTSVGGSSTTGGSTTTIPSELPNSAGRLIVIPTAAYQSLENSLTSQFGSQPATVTLVSKTPKQVVCTLSINSTAGSNDILVTVSQSTDDGWTVTYG